jgi:hypothetical protein
VLSAKGKPLFVDRLFAYSTAAPATGPQTITSARGRNIRGRRLVHVGMVHAHLFPEKLHSGYTMQSSQPTGRPDIEGNYQRLGGGRFLTDTPLTESAGPVAATQIQRHLGGPGVSFLVDSAD